jgi:hypothetical protein
MRRFLAALIAAAAMTAMAPVAQAAPSWHLESSASSTTVAPGGGIEYFVRVANFGDEATSPGACPGPECQRLTVTLPAGLTVASAHTVAGDNAWSCEVSGPQSASCGRESALGPALARSAFRKSVTVTAVAAPEAAGILSAALTVEGGGAPAATIHDPTLASVTEAPFGIEAFDGQLLDDRGEEFTQAGGHPATLRTQIDLNNRRDATIGSPYPSGAPRDILVDLPAGLVGNPTVAGTCTAAELAVSELIEERPLCPSDSQVGTSTVFTIKSRTEGDQRIGPLPLFNIQPPAGVAARFGFNVLGTPVMLDATLATDGSYRLTVGSRLIPAALAVTKSHLEFWGTPADPGHDPERACPGEEAPSGGGPTCTAGINSRLPFLRLPTSCSARGDEWALRADSWEEPGKWVTASYRNHEAPGYPASPLDPQTPWGAELPQSDCELVPVKGKLDLSPTTLDAESSSGLRVSLEVPNPGIENPAGIASSDLKRVEVSLPRGVTINPSQAEGLGTCSPGEYESTELSFHPTPGKGCPSDSKIGTVAVRTPLLEETVPGEVFVAEPFANPFGSLLAIYIVLEEPQRGILVKLPGEIETEGGDGRIRATFDDLPQLPFSSFEFKFREGARAPLVTPPTCGPYTTQAKITGWSDPSEPIETSSTFQITRGIGGGPCPPGGTPGFDPGFSAGTINNAAGAFSPTVMRLTRRDGEQDLTKFSAVLPKGLLAKLAGVAWCPDAAIGSAKAKSGKQELASPSCPAGSKIGRTLAGAGVGSVLTYVPGSLYLAGPYNGAPLSVVAITPAVAGPFDVGTVVVREALDLDPVTGVASVDGAASDPIPHILAGIPLKLRDLRVYVDRPGFTLNPTSCGEDNVLATLWGSAADVFNAADDVPVNRASRFQAASCGLLGFEPRLRVVLKGGVKRGAHPALRAVFTPRPGEANLSRAAVVLPRSAFLEQAHIRTICTRVQFAAGAGHGSACPEGSRYGYARAWSPLLDQPLQGPVYLRSSENKLPDMVLALRGLVDIEAAGRIDSVPVGGGDFGIRAIFAAVPDAPLSRVVLDMQGGKKGLIVNSRHLCRKPSRNRMRSNLTGQNGKRSSTRPVVRSLTCKKKRKAKRRKAKRSAHRSVARAKRASERR